MKKIIIFLLVNLTVISLSNANLKERFEILSKQSPNPSCENLDVRKLRDESISDFDNASFTVDIETFKFLSNYDRIHYYIDKNNVYSCSIKDVGSARSLLIMSFMKIIDSDPMSFEILNNNYSKDKNNVYYQGKKLNKIDSKSFKLLGGHYNKDKNFVYFGREKIKGADSKTFKFIDDTYTKDKNNIYYMGKKMKNVDLETFEIFDYRYSRDKIYVYEYGEVSMRDDFKTFTCCGQ